MNRQFVWKKEYNIGIQRIDHQHQYFFQLINWLLLRLDSSKDFKLKQRYIDEVMYYARFHFCSEENLMKDHDYPELKQQEILHGKLVKEMNYKISQLEFNDIDTSDFVAFLSAWLLEHTISEDKKIGKFLSEVNVRD